MLIEQAIFTSAESDHAVGYHLVARSPGVDECDARELSVWGPSHDSLESSSVATAASVNFFRLPSGAYCVSKTLLAGEEYSGRGLRTYTHCLIVSPPVLARFANNPFALLRAAWAKGLLRVCDAVPSQLVPFQLAGRAAPVDEGLIGQLVENCGASTIGRLIEAVLKPLPVVLIGVRKPEATVAGILNLLPLSARGELSFATGLTYSPRRPFHLLISSEESAELRRLYRQQLVTVIDVAPPVGVQASPSVGGQAAASVGVQASACPGVAGRPSATSPTGWGGYLADCIGRDALAMLVEQLRDRKEGLHLTNLNELGEHLRRELPAYTKAARPRAAATPANPSDSPAFANGASTTDDDFLALLLAGQPHAEAEPESDDDADTTGIYDETDHAAARKVHLQRLTYRQAPSVLIEVESSANLERLEKLDDVVFDAMAGDERALEEMNRLWPQLVTELGPDKLEESREQYLRYSLAIWESCLEDGLREPDRAIASLQVLSIIFGER
ncbi:MAG: hypothetical protein WD894_26110 [Pirellulales bacterium]